MKLVILSGGMALMIFLFLPSVWAAQELSDQELDGIAAGAMSVDVADGVMRFQAGDETGRISIAGDVSVNAAPNDVPPGQIGILELRDNAQGNLQSFINVNAVNSVVQVLINLNVNIDSTVGVLRQGNSSLSF